MIERVFENMPDRMKSLPVSDKGFPIPYFAAEVDGVRDFRVVSPQKMQIAVRKDLCWVCGFKLGKYKAFVIGPMCGINRTISDPPSHRECAIFSAVNCPFLSRPLAQRRAAGTEDFVPAAGFGLKRNPGATGVWITESYRRFKPGAGVPGMLFRLGEPTDLLWFASGRKATRAEVQHSIDTGLPHLRELADLDGPDGVEALSMCVAQFSQVMDRFAAGFQA